MTIEIVDFPIENGDFYSFFVCLPEGIDALSIVKFIDLTSLSNPKFTGESWPWSSAFWT